MYATDFDELPTACWCGGEHPMVGDVKMLGRTPQRIIGLMHRAGTLVYVVWRIGNPRRPTRLNRKPWP